MGDLDMRIEHWAEPRPSSRSRWWRQAEPTAAVPVPAASDFCLVFANADTLSPGSISLIQHATDANQKVEVFCAASSIPVEVHALRRGREMLVELNAWDAGVTPSELIRRRLNQHVVGLDRNAQQNIRARILQKRLPRL